MICMARPSVLPMWNRLLEVRWVHSSSASYVTNNDVHWRSLCTGHKLARASAGKETELRPLNLEKKNVLVYCGTNGRGMWKKWSDWTTAFMVVTRNIMLHLRVGFFEDWMYERIPILLCVFTKRSMNHQCNMDSVRLLTMAQGSSRGLLRIARPWVQVVDFACTTENDALRFWRGTARLKDLASIICTFSTMQSRIRCSWYFISTSWTFCSTLQATLLDFFSRCTIWMASSNTQHRGYTPLRCWLSTSTTAHTWTCTTAIPS